MEAGFAQKTGDRSEVEADDVQAQPGQHGGKLGADCNQHQPFLSCFRSEDWYQQGFIEDEAAHGIADEVGHEGVVVAPARGEEHNGESDDEELLFLV